MSGKQGGSKFSRAERKDFVSEASKTLVNAGPGQYFKERCDQACPRQLFVCLLFVSKLVTPNKNHPLFSDLEQKRHEISRLHFQVPVAMNFMNVPLSRPLPAGGNFFLYATFVIIGWEKARESGSDLKA
jgi:hypothetical protein